jgi:hypothetical protein
VAQTQQRAGMLDRDAELFLQLARQGGRAGLARLDFAARKFPAAGEVLARGPLRDEDPAAPVEEHRCRDMDRRHAVLDAQG